MKEYLVINCICQEIFVYHIVAETANTALIKSRGDDETPIKIYQHNDVFGDGGVAIPYSLVKIATFVLNLLFGKAEAKAPIKTMEERIWKKSAITR